MNEELQAASHHIHGESIKEHIITEVRPDFFLNLMYTVPTLWILIYASSLVYICFCSIKPVFVTPKFWVFFSTFT